MICLIYINFLQQNSIECNKYTSMYYVQFLIRTENNYDINTWLCKYNINIWLYNEK